MSGAFSRSTATVFGAQLIGFAAAFVAGVILTRVLGPLGKGEYTAVVTLCALLVLVGGMGLGSAAIYHLAGAPGARGPIAAVALGLHLLGVGILALSALPLLPWLSSTLFGTALPAWLLAAGLLLALPAAAAETLGLLLIAVGASRRYALGRLALSLGQLAIFAALALSGQLSVGSALGGFATATLITVLLSAVWLGRAGVIPSPQAMRQWVRPLLAYGGRAWIGNLLQYFNYRLDVFLLLGIAGTAAVGRYSVAVALAEALWFLPQSVALLLFPRTAADNQAAGAFTPVVVRNTLLISALGATALGILAGPLIPLLYGDAFAPAYPALLILLPGVVCFAAAKVIAGDLNGRGLPQYGTWGAVISLVLTVVLDLILIPRLGINGAALASTIAYAANAGLLIRLYIGVTGCALGDLLIVRPHDLDIYRRLARRAVARVRP